MAALRFWGPIRSDLKNEFSFGDIKEIVGYAGLDMPAMAHLEQKSGSGGATKSQLLSAIDTQMGRMNEYEANRVAVICCEEMLRRRPGLLDTLTQSLSGIGWQFEQGKLIPVEIFDTSELTQLPVVAHEDLLKAATRLRDGDLSGAVSSACGAIDSATNSIYERYGLGDPANASFQERIKKSLDALNVKSDLETELTTLDWEQKKLNMFCNNLFQSLNQASFVMQSLRNSMADVHGTKQVLGSLVYDSLKWSAIILRFLSENSDP